MMRQLIAATIAALVLMVYGAAYAQRTGGSFGMSSWRSSPSINRSTTFSRPSTPYRSTTLTRPSSLVSRPAINRVGSYGATRFDRHVAWWPNLHDDRHDHHVIVVGGDEHDGTTGGGTVAAFFVAFALLVCIVAYQRRNF